MIRDVLRAVGIVAMLLSTACLAGAGWAWMTALIDRPANVGLMDGNLWTRLNPEGIRRRNIGFRFAIGSVGLFGVGWLFLWAGT